MHTRFILIETSHAGNVRAAARAMKTMGFADLVLVAPRWPNDVISLSHVALPFRPDDPVYGVLPGSGAVFTRGSDRARSRITSRWSARLARLCHSWGSSRWSYSSSEPSA